MAIPFFVQAGLALLGSASKKEQPQVQLQHQNKPLGNVTSNLTSLPAKLQQNVYDSPLTNMFGYTPATLQTQPGATNNVAQVAAPIAGQPIPGNPNVAVVNQTQPAWQAAWEAQQRQQQEQRKTEFEYAKQNPLYGMFYGIGAGVQRRAG